MIIHTAEAFIDSISCSLKRHDECSGEAMDGVDGVGHELDLLVSPCICPCHDGGDLLRRLAEAIGPYGFLRDGRWVPE